MSEEILLRERISAPLQLDIVYVGGDLFLEGSSSDELLISGEGAQIERPADGQLRLECDADCHVRVPPLLALRVGTASGELRAADLSVPLIVEQCQADLIVRTLRASLHVESVAADARIAQVEGAVTIGSVGANLTLRAIDGSISVDQVGANLDVKRVTGSCQVRSVGGDACLRDVRGGLRIERVGADAVLTDVQGDCRIDQVGADLVLDLPFEAGKRAEFGAVGADMLVKVRSGSAVTFTLPCQAEKIVSLRGAQLERGAEVDTIYVGKLSDSCAEVTVKALGGVFELIGQSKRFSGAFEFSMPDNLGEIISSQISQQLSRLEQTLAERAEAVAQRMTERARDRGKGAARMWRWSGEADDFAPKPPRSQPSPVTEAERLAILRMVEERKITIDEAERLLAALEGRE